MSMWMILRMRLSSIGGCYSISGRLKIRAQIECTRLGSATENEGNVLALEGICAADPRRVTMVSVNASGGIGPYGEEEDSRSNTWSKEDLRELKAHSKRGHR
jgi:hypothetical protein